MSDRVLLLSWEYPPVIEGGLARHVRKLAEALVRRGVEVDVLTRGAGEGCAEVYVEERDGVSVHRVPEPGWPTRPRPVRRVGSAHERRHARGRPGACAGALL